MQNMQRMPSGGRQIKYKRNRYRRRRLRNVIIAAVLALIALFVIFLIVGNSLKDKVSEDTQAPEDAPSVSEEHFTPREISSYCVPVSSLSSSLGAIPQGGGAGIILTDKEGNPLYRSELGGDGGTALASIVSNAEGRGIYSCGIIYCNLFESESDLERARQLGYFASLSAEAARGGFDEILLICQGATEASLEEIAALCREVKRLAEDSVLGIALPVEFYTSENNTEIIDKIWAEADFLGVDLTGVSSEEIESVLSNNISFYFLYKKVRALIPETADEELNSLFQAAVEMCGTHNFQKISVE